MGCARSHPSPSTSLPSDELVHKPCPEENLIVRSSPPPQETWLIENTLVQRSDGSLLMLFRTQMGTAYHAVSRDGGKSWSAPSPTPTLSNPDSKLHLSRLNPKGPLVVAYNDHKFMRTDLALALSFDEVCAEVNATQTLLSHLTTMSKFDQGSTFQKVVSLESSDAHGVMIHYPTIQQVRVIGIHEAVGAPPLLTKSSRRWDAYSSLYTPDSTLARRHGSCTSGLTLPTPSVKEFELL
eukprot:scaffold4120_cov400-Prasinococcus_capsulatus_cf.AAC.27